MMKSKKRKMKAALMWMGAIRIAIVGYLIACSIVSASYIAGMDREWRINHRAPLMLADVQIITAIDKHTGFNQHGEIVGIGNNDVLAGDKILTVIVYNPLSNWEDDALGVWDIAVWEIGEG